MEQETHDLWLRKYVDTYRERSRTYRRFEYTFPCLKCYFDYLRYV